MHTLSPQLVKIGHLSHNLYTCPTLPPKQDLHRGYTKLGRNPRTEKLVITETVTMYRFIFTSSHKFAILAFRRMVLTFNRFQQIRNSRTVCPDSSGPDRPMIEQFGSKMTKPDRNWPIRTRTDQNFCFMKPSFVRFFDII